MDIDEILSGKDSSHGGQDNSEPLKSRLFEWLRDHTQRKRGFLRKAAKDLNIDYDKKKELLWKYSSEFHTSLFSIPQSGRGSDIAVCSKPDKQHACFATVDVPNCLDRHRFVEVEKLAVEAGWVPSKNRNRALIWDKPWGSEGLRLGRIEWWMTGFVRLHVQKPSTKGKAKQLLYSAFVSTGLILDRTISDKFLNDVIWYGSHDVYVYEKPLPYKKITTYKELGITEIVTGDLSDKRGLEVHVVKPDIVTKYELFLVQITKLLEQQQMKDQTTNKLIEANNLAIQQFNEYLRDVSVPKTKAPERLYE